MTGVLARATGYAFTALVLIVGALQVWYLAHVVYWVHFNPVSTAFMERRLEELRATRPSAQLRHQWMPYERISVHLKRAVVASEDARFVEHEGFDWEAIQKALERNEKRGRVVAGGSTITQQLAKNLFLSGERSWLRKAQEAAITWMLERAMSKRRILELYLNVAEWGEGVFGAEAAARYHFGVPASALRPEQAVYLAVILPSPRRYAPGRLTPYLAERVVSVHARMRAVQIP
ncbi:MAG TPA: monofunctional biosynthetic peptidoglycan transglycosylase [Burkholderiales bacterium]|nr:monofunctional biosynthetic peptidoglycan transglycosylase [Burkholderiales bacterium]